MTTTRNLRLAAVATSILLWLASLRLPAVVLQLSEPGRAGAPRVPVGVDVNTGLWMLVFSLGGFVQANFAGVANLLLIIGWFQLARRDQPRTVPQALPPANGYFAPSTTLFRSLNSTDTRILLGAALLLTLQTFQLKISGIPYDEGVVKRGFLLHLLPGWYLWVLSIAIPFAVSLMRTEPDTR